VSRVECVSKCAMEGKGNQVGINTTAWLFYVLFRECKKAFSMKL